MNELIPITYANDRPAVSARELHEFLEVKTAFKDWLPRMCEYGFTEGTDFAKLPAQKRATNNPKNPWTKITDYVLSLDMAKELCMIQRTQRSMDMGLFKVKETAITHSDGHVTVNRTTKVTGKGQQYFINKFLGGTSRCG